MARDGNTHVYKGKTFTEALTKAKKELGGELLIVQRRDIPEKKSLFKKLAWGKTDALSVELEVSVDHEKKGAASKEKNVENPIPPHPLLRTYTKALEGVEKHSPAAKQAMTDAAEPYISVGDTATGVAKILDEVRKTLEAATRENNEMRDELRSLVSLQARGGLPAVNPELLACYRELVAHEVGEDVAREIVEDIQREYPGASGEEIAGLLSQSVARRIPVSGPILLRENGPTVVALVGPSGVGKTTTAVKLAIHYAMRCRKAVGVINEDLRRPGAEAQINNIGRLVGAAVAQASGEGEMADVVRSFCGKDLIFIDTAGRSPRDAKGIEGLGRLLRAAGAHEVHLLLSSVSSERMMAETATRYRDSGFDRLILTKLDECLGHGAVVNVGSRLAHGFSYITTGSDYKLPITIADSAMLAELVMGRKTVDVDCYAEAR